MTGQDRTRTSCAVTQFGSGYRVQCAHCTAKGRRRATTRFQEMLCASPRRQCFPDLAARKTQTLEANETNALIGGRPHNGRNGSSARLPSPLLSSPLTGYAYTLQLHFTSLHFTAAAAAAAARDATRRTSSDYTLSPQPPAEFPLR